MKSIFAVVIVFCLFLSPKASFSEALSYDKVLSDAMNRSRKLAGARLDQEIKGFVVRESRYLRYPELSFKFYSEQVNDLSDDSGLTSVGGTVFSEDSKFQNTAYADVNYNLVDYGIAGKQIAIAEMDETAAAALVDQAGMDVETAVLDLYSSILSLYLDIRYGQRVLDLTDRMNTMRKRTGAAGISDRLSVLDRDIERAGLLDRMCEFRFELSLRLKDLTFYTGVSYDPDSLEVSPLAFDFGGMKEIDYRKNPEYRYYEYQVRIKDAEAAIEKKRFYPGVGLYLRYSFYGMDDHDYFKSFEEVREKNFTAGIYTSIPLMENLKRRHTLSRIRSEMMKAKEAMEEKYDELKTTFGKLETRYAFYVKDLDNKKELLSLVREKSQMIKRLTDAKLMDQEKGLEQESSLLQQELELEKKIVERMTALRHILIQTEGVM